MVAASSPAQPEQRRTPSCEDALRNASQKIPPLADVNALSRAVAACIKQRWPDELRRCVAGVRDERDLDACGQQGKQQLGVTSRESRDSAEYAIARMTDFKVQMCECVDKACADQVTEAMTRWGQEMAKASDDSPAITDEESKRMGMVTEEMVQCMTRAMTAGMKPAGDAH